MSDRFGRKDIAGVEIDCERCALRYGVGGCSAALSADTPNKCYNTRETCQDLDSYEREVFTLRYVQNVNGLPKTEHGYPVLNSLGGNPVKISLGGTDGRMGTMGRRARMSVSITDFKDNDNAFDYYADERRSGAANFHGDAWEPEEKATHFRKLQARWPYYYGRALRVLYMQAGDDYADAEKEHYIITKRQGPSGGAVTYEVQSPLILADKDKAQCPAASNGILFEDIDNEATTLTLVAAGVGDDEYPASGKVSIGSEIAAFTRSGDELTLTERGTDGTEASSHNAGDTVQLCYVVTDGKIQDVLNDLLKNYAELPEPWLDDYTDDAWSGECDRWLSGLCLNRVIPKPEAVIDLVGQLLELGIAVWEDVPSQRIKLRVNRPNDIGEAAVWVTDSDDMLENSIAVTNLDEKRLSQVWAIHASIRANGSAKDINNFKIIDAPVALNKETEDEYNQSKVLEVFLPWLGLSGDSSYAQTIAQRLLDRYENTPKAIVFDAPIVDRFSYGIGALIQLETRHICDIHGEPLVTDMQVVEQELKRSTGRVRVTAETYKFTRQYGFITENSRGEYGASTDAQKDQGTYFIDENTLKFPDGRGPYRFF